MCTVSTLDNCNGGRGRGIRLSWIRRMGARMIEDLRRSQCTGGGDCLKGWSLLELGVGESCL